MTGPRSLTPVDDRAADAVTPVVLAGGDSTRFGDDRKALATLDGTPLVRRVCDRVRAAVDGEPVVAVADDTGRTAIDAALSDLPVRYVTDHPGHEGPIAGVRAGLSAVETDWFLLVACDMPLLDPRILGALVAAGRDGVAEDAVDAVVPRVDGHWQPLHACYRTAGASPAVADLSPAAGLHAMLDRLRIRTVTGSELPAQASLDRSLTNVNTRAELSDIRPIAGRPR